MKDKLELKEFNFLYHLRYFLASIIVTIFVMPLHAQIPYREWSTYHGGTFGDSFRDMAIDATGNVYVIGSTQSSDAISTSGGYQSLIAGGWDVFLAKYDTNGNKIWATYYGGSGDDFGRSIDLDVSGNIFITGYSYSTNGMTTGGTHQPLNNGNGDAFIAKFNTNGNRIWGSFLGGENSDFANDIEIDNLGNPIIAGWTNSTNNIATAGSFQNMLRGQNDVLIAKFDTNGRLLWSTYFGDIEFDEGLQVESDGIGNVVVSGWTSSTNTIVTPGAFQNALGGNGDCFLAVFNSNGNRLWSTYYGGNGDDYSSALLVTASGDIYLSGATNSANNIASPSAIQPLKAAGFDNFIARFSTTGARFWATYFGGNGDDTAFRLREGNDAALYVVGHTTSTNVMATPGAYQFNKSAGTDVFISRFEIDGTLTWSSYYGGMTNDLGYGLVIDSKDDIFICGLTEGSTNLSTADAAQTSFGGGLDGFVSKFSLCTVPELNFSNSGFSCAPVNYVFDLELIGSPPFTIYYSIDGIAQTPWITNNANFFPTVDANQWTKVIQLDSVKSGSCKGIINSTFGFIKVRDSIRASSPAIICNNTTNTYTVTLDLSGGAFGTFQSVGTNGGIINITTSQFVSNPIPFNDPYVLQFTEAGTFSDCDTITLMGISGCLDPCQPLNVNLTSNSPVCAGSSIMFNAGSWTNYQWSGPNGFTSNVSNPEISIARANNGGVYTVTVTDANGCTGTAATLVIINQPSSGNISSNSPVCFGSEIKLFVSGGMQYQWSGPDNFSSTGSNPVISNASDRNAGIYSVTVTDTQGCVKTASITVTVTSALNVQISSNSPLCSGSTLTLMSGGGTSYQWSGPNGFTSPLQNPVISNATGINSGAYIVTVTASTNCTATASTQVLINNLMNVSTSSNSPVCAGKDIILLSSGGSSYQWSGPNGFTSNIQNPIISNSMSQNAGSYQVTVTATDGCSTILDLLVEVRSLPMAVLSSNSPVCYGGEINFQVSGGESYMWKGPNNFTSTVQNPAILNANIANSGTYNVTVTGSNGCTTNLSTVVTVSGQLNTSISSNSPVCEGDTLRLISNGGIKYQWSGPNGYISSDQNPIISNSSMDASGNYALTVSDISGCTVTKQINVEVKAKPLAIITGAQEICEGETLILQSPTIGILLWNTNETGPAITVTPSVDTNYSLVAELNGCRDTAMFAVIVSPKPDLNLNVDNTNITSGASTQLNATGGDTYNWTPGTSLSCTLCANPIATPTETTTYCVLATLDGCTADTCVVISVLENCQLIFANIFSPNGDGINDNWCSKVQDCITFQTLHVYDRWGNLVYQAAGQEFCWDGTFGGKELEPQVFTYFLTFTLKDDKSLTRAGSLTLVK